MTFAEGEGTGEEFKEESWMLASQRRQGKDATQTRSPSNDTFGIRKNPYSKKETPEKVIRLFDLIKPYSAPESAAEEDPDNSFTDYRSTRAMLNQLVPLNGKSQFSTKFTFSLPDACVNTEQAGAKNSPERSAAMVLPFFCIKRIIFRTWIMVETPIHSACKITKKPHGRNGFPV